MITLMILTGVRLKFPIVHWVVLSRLMVHSVLLVNSVFMFKRSMSKPVLTPFLKAFQFGLLAILVLTLLFMTLTNMLKTLRPLVPRVRLRVPLMLRVANLLLLKKLCRIMLRVRGR